MGNDDVSSFSGLDSVGLDFGGGDTGFLFGGLVLITFVRVLVLEFGYTLYD